MKFLFKTKKQKTTKAPSTKEKFYKKRSWKIGMLVLGSFALVFISFLAYLYAQSSRMFVDNLGNNNSFLKNLKSSLSSEPLQSATKGRINIVIVGMGGAGHPGGTLTDSIMVVSLKPEDHALAMLSVPRDLYVAVPDHKSKVKLNEVYYLGEKEQKGSGPTLLKKTLASILGIPIDYYVSVDFKGFERIIDEVGGVDVTVDKNLYDPYYPDAAMEGYAPFSIKAGPQHLNGATALKYARSRETTSDFDRAARQQKVLVALKEKVLTLGFFANPKKLMDLTTILGDHIKTDISPAEIRTLAEEFKNLDGSKIFSKVLTNGVGGPLYSDSSSGTYYLMPKGGDFSLVKSIAENIFSSEPLDQTTKIEISNGSTISGAAYNLSDVLKSYGYEITSVKNAEEKANKTVIYDYSKGTKASALAFLKEKLNAEVVQKDEEKPTADIMVLIGDNYKSLTATSGTSTKTKTEDQETTTPEQTDSATTPAQE